VHWQTAWGTGPAVAARRTGGTQFVDDATIRVSSPSSSQRAKRCFLPLARLTASKPNRRSVEARNSRVDACSGEALHARS
jgi:hypothetical protein